MQNEKEELKNKQLAGGVTQTQVDTWKQKYGKVYKLTIPSQTNPDEKLTAYARKPDKNVLAAAAPHMQSDPIKAGDILRNNCYLAGDSELLKNDEYIIGLNIKIGELFKVAIFEVEEL